ncbi:MAG: MBL fold metallo-hydrolase [Ardenticatenales bacterium]|nr:MBL fold metallo-hydrolase [Ardenticatenales bacterium]
MKQIAPGLHTFTGLMAGRVYLIEDADGLTIIDTSIAMAPERIVRQLEQAGHTAKAVKRILITHGHPDHIGGLPKLQAMTGAEVITSETEKPVVEGREVVARAPKESLSALSRLMLPKEQRFPGTPVHRTVQGGEVLAEVMGGLQVVATPGHSPGHIAFWQPERRILFCGDVVMGMMGLTLPFAAFTVDMAENKRSVARLTALAPAILCLGHGEPVTEGTSQRLHTFAQKVGAAT